MLGCYDGYTKVCSSHLELNTWTQQLVLEGTADPKTPPGFPGPGPGGL